MANSVNYLFIISLKRVSSMAEYQKNKDPQKDKQIEQINIAPHSCPSLN
ncbi:replicative DNA helicase domain protein [Glaesserella parasuis 12939]|nr:replicative DNA helicase domain protein [Glaesserella parasuis 12939]